MNDTETVQVPPIIIIIIIIIIINAQWRTTKWWALYRQLWMWSQQRKPYSMEPANTASYSVHVDGWNRKNQHQQFHIIILWFC